ncbi:MAG: ROK family protein, partial [Microthrixaceae bacterium]
MSVNVPGPPALYVGVDVGGTKSVAVAIADGPGGMEVLDSIRSTSEPGIGTLSSLVASLLERLDSFRSGSAVAAHAQPTAVGVGVAGWVDHGRVPVRSPHVPSLIGIDLAAGLSSTLGVPVVVDNDGNCTALAAAGQFDTPPRCLVAITFGTGIGAGLIIDGRLHRGANGFAGEPGHMVVDPTGPPCACGQSGCWETFASGPGVAHLAAKSICSGTLHASAVGNTSSPGSEAVFEAARSGDPEASAVVDEFATWVARGLGAVANVLDPDVIALGGGLASSADTWLPRVR